MEICCAHVQWQALLLLRFFFWLHHGFTLRKLFRGKTYNAFTLTGTYLKNAYTSSTLMSKIKHFLSFYFLLFLQEQTEALVDHQFGKKTLLFPFASSKANRYQKTCLNPKFVQLPRKISVSRRHIKLPKISKFLDYTKVLNASCRIM